MEQKINSNHERDFFQSVIIIVRRYIFLILAIIMFSVATGILYAQTRKPYYVASELVVYNVEGIDNGGSGSANDEKYAFSARRLLLNTIVDFCRQGIVLDRAEYYYDEYLKMGTMSSETLQAFIEDVESGTKYVYDVETHVKEERVHFGGTTSVGSQSASLTEEEIQDMNFTISVKDEDVNVAKDKLRIFALAIDRELAENKEVFPNMTNSIEELGAGKEEGRAGISAYCTLSKSKLIITAGLIGVVCAIVLALILFYTDSTVKERYEIESLTGAALLANIEMIEGE